MVMFCVACVQRLMELKNSKDIKGYTNICNILIKNGLFDEGGYRT